MNTLKIEKRMAEQLDRIRKAAAGLPTKQRNAILCGCDRLTVIGRKAARQLNTAHRRGAVADAPYDARTEEDMAAQAEAKKAVFNALLAGSRVDLTDAARFHVSQMHTVICKIRKEIDANGLPMVMCNEWHRPEGRRPYKRYWIVKKEAQP